MSEDDHPEKVKIQSQTSQYPPALIVQRFAAMLIDSLIIGIIISPLSYVLELERYVESGAVLPYPVIIQLYIGIFAAYVLVNGWLLYRYGQTVGKRMLKIAIATDDYQVPSFNRLIFVRYVPFLVTGIFPILSAVNIFDGLLIFKPDRRCLHDILAGTQVIYVR